jgi:hypothetical protein
MFVGYPPGHACDIYRMLSMKATHVIKSRDIKWLRKTYEAWSVKDGPNNEMDDIQHTNKDCCVKEGPNN